MTDDKNKKNINYTTLEKHVTSVWPWRNKFAPDPAASSAGRRCVDSAPRSFYDHPASRALRALPAGRSRTTSCSTLRIVCDANAENTTTGSWVFKGG